MVLCAVAPGAEGRRAPDARSEIEELLARRAAAVRARDRDAFLGTVADVVPGFRRRQARLFTRLELVPFDKYELNVRWDELGDLARPSDRRRYVTADRVSIPLTEERYRIAGYDDSDAVEDVFYTFVKQDDAWLIASDSDLEDVGMYSARHLWDFGPLYLRKTPHFLLFGHPCGSPGAPERDCERLPQSFLSLAETALQRMRRYWRGPWHERVVVLVPGSARELAAILQATFEVQEFVAFAYSTVDTRRGIRFTAPRIVFNQRSLQTRADDDIVSVLAHELLHVATRSSSGPFVPVFVEEGFADYVGRDADPSALLFLANEIARGTFDRSLPQDFEFTTGTGTDIFRSYQESHSAVRFFIERWGRRAFVQFYRRLGRVRVAPGFPRYHMDRALRRTIGIGLRRFEQAWADSID